MKRALLLGVVFALLLSAPAILPQRVEASNRSGPQLAAWIAHDLVGTPHRFGGADPVGGMDNSGLVYYVFQQLGVDMPRTLASQASFGSLVERDELEAGDIVFFSSASTNRPAHVGIYLGNGEFVASSSQTAGVVRRSLARDYYVTYYHSARRASPDLFLPLSDVVGNLARQSMGIPYLVGGQSARGLDEVGLARYLFSHIYIGVPNNLTDLASVGVNVRQENLRPGDIMLFSNGVTRDPFRVGIYLGNREFVTTAENLGGVVLRTLDWPWYASHYLGARRPYANFDEPAGFNVLADPQVVQPAPAPAPVVPEPPTPVVRVADQVVAAATGYLGVPYRLGATGPTAFDCSGFTQSVYRQFGISLPRTAASQSQVGSLVRSSELEKGDLVFFRNTWRNDGSIDHVAIYMGDGRLIHAITRSGVTITNSSGYWADHFSHGRRVIHP